MASPAWSLSGNAGTNPANNFLGTSDAQPLVFKTRGAEHLRIDTNGNVGIGTTAPVHPLHLPAGKTLRIEGGTSASDNADYFSFGGNGTFGIDAYRIPNGRFVVQNSGNVGIGISNPITILHAQGASDQQSTLAISRSDNNKFVRLGVGTGGVALDFDSSSYLVIQNNGGLGIGGILNGYELLRVTAGGSVGIGTGGPATRLHVQGASDQQSTLAMSRSDNNKFVRLGVGSSGVTLEIDPTSFFSVSNNNGIGVGATLNGIELLRVTASGSVGIGTSAPASKLHVIGDITVSGDILFSGADCAEDFDASDKRLPEPGTVVVIDENGALRECREAYDKKVAGVVSGAGEYRHGLVLDKRAQDGRIPVALVGKVFCKVSAEYSSIHVGDLLTTSPMPGYAMKATNAAKAFGAVLGKALGSLNAGQGLVPILVALQ